VLPPFSPFCELPPPRPPLPILIVPPVLTVIDE